MDTTQKIMFVGYFCYNIFTDFIELVKHFTNCQLYTSRVQDPPTLLHPIIIADPFCKWAIDFMVFNPPYFGGHKYIIMVIDYFMKQAKAM
jgi:hypothetical protein